VATLIGSRLFRRRLYSRIARSSSAVSGKFRYTQNNRLSTTARCRQIHIMRLPFRSFPSTLPVTSGKTMSRAKTSIINSAFRLLALLPSVLTDAWLSYQIFTRLTRKDHGSVSRRPGRKSTSAMKQRLRRHSAHHCWCQILHQTESGQRDIGLVLAGDLLPAKTMATTTGCPPSSTGWGS